MGKQKQNLGKSLIRDHRKKRVFVKDDFRHVSDLPDGMDWACLNLRSITEQTTVDDFLGKTELAESEYVKEFGNIKIINPEVDELLLEKEKGLMTAAQDLNKQFINIPRRPKWNEQTTKEDLESLEKAAFLDWRRNLAKLSEEKYINLTPYEKNLEVWRQLWRVIERSDVVVQIIDARNPLLFRSEDLETYVKEVGPKKNILLLNKADFLTEEQRHYWAEYFQEINVSIVFFSALQQNEKLSQIEENQEKDEDNDSSDDDSYEDVDEDTHTNIKESCLQDVAENSIKNAESNLQGNIIEPTSVDIESQGSASSSTIFNNSKIYSREELIEYFKQFKDPNSSSNFVTVGLVGYPNVGKSSTVNALTQVKRTQVSATPGKTKHFQTLMIEPELCLCDSPGLVFPTFISSKAEMIINGILPIDHLTDHNTPMSLIVSFVPKVVLEAMYNILIPYQNESNPDKITAEDFLNAFGYMRGILSQRGIPDNARCSRYILKDYINGRLLHCHAPPGMKDYEYQKYTIRPIKQRSTMASKQLKSSKTCVMSKELDKSFFQQAHGQAHMKGNKPLMGTKDISETGKSWKKHNNKNKREKLRRVYSASDYK